MSHQFKKGDLVHIGEPPNTELYVIVSEPVGDYAEVQKMPAHTESETLTVYIGRWFIFDKQRQE